MRNILLFILSFGLYWGCQPKPTPEQIILGNPYYDRAFDWLEEDVQDSAFHYFYLAKDLFLHQGDEFGAGKCFANMAMIMYYQGDYLGAQESSIEAIQYFDPNMVSHHHNLASNYNLLASAASRLNDQVNALQYFDAAISFAQDTVERYVYLNNKATSYQKTEEYEAASVIYAQILENQTDTNADYARALTNLAVTRWLENPEEDVAGDLLKGLQIRENTEDLWGLNSSYFHLTEYYSVKNVDSALYYAQAMYNIATELKSAGDQIHALQKMMQFGPEDAVKEYFEEYQVLNDSVQVARTEAKNQFAVIRYEVDKIKASNLELQQDNELKKYQLSRQRLLLVGLILFVAAFSFLIYYWQKRRRQRLELETQFQIKTHQLQTSQKIHDVVANGIYRVIATIENQPTLDRENILDQLDEMYEKSRDISYEAEPKQLQHRSPEQRTFDQQVADLLKSFSSPATQVIIVGNSKAFWDQLHEETHREILSILQELMVNMRKHSQADRVIVRFEESEGQLIILYHDNGIGLSASFKVGNGLKNMENRMDSVGGILTFEPAPDQGLKLRLSLPTVL